MKLKALLEGLKIENPEYWAGRSEKELNDLGRCLSNQVGKLDSQLVIESLVECSDRLRILKDNGRAKLLDNLAIDNADFALAAVGVFKDDQ